MLALMLTAALLLPGSARAQEKTPTSWLIPIGGDYEPALDGFAQAVIANLPALGLSRQASILVLPIAYAENPISISQEGRDELLRQANERRVQVEAACQNAAGSDITCTAILSPILVRADAEQADLKTLFPDDLAAVFILGGDQTVAMQVILGTPFEDALEQAYRRGVIVAGTSAGAAVQSRPMLAGYQDGYDVNDGLRFGAASLWDGEGKRGLPFGLEDAIIDQHFMELGRAARLLNAISSPAGPHLGIGLDANTGARIADGQRIEGMFGQYSAVILDAETYHAAEGVQYSDSRMLLSLRNVLFHTLAPGAFTYDLSTRQHSLAEPAARIERQIEGLSLPAGAGPLLLVSGLEDSAYAATGLANFANWSGGRNARILIVAAGYPDEQAASADLERITAHLDAHTETMLLTPEGPSPARLPVGITGIVVTSKDPSQINPRHIAWVKESWLSGLPLLMNDAAAAAAGAFYTSQPPAVTEGEQAEADAQMTMLQGNTQMTPGLALLDILIEPDLLRGNRWGRFISLAYAHPELAGFGMAEGAFLEITLDGARLLGDNGMIALDLRRATLAVGENNGLVIANGLLDVFAPDDWIRPALADRNAAPVPLPTPALNEPAPAPPAAAPTLTPTPTPAALATATPLLEEAQPQGKPTRTPRPSPTPLTVPPPADPASLTMMVAFGVLTVIVVIVGVLIHRRKVF